MYWITAILLAQTIQTGKPVFEALSGHHNLTPWSHVSGVPAPDFVWSGDDVDGSDDSCSETGTTTEVATPFCSHGTCMKARRFELNEYYTCGDRMSLEDDSKISVVTISRKSPSGGDDTVASHHSGAQGWIAYHIGASHPISVQVNNSGGVDYGVGVNAGEGQWVFSCATMDDDDNDIFMHANGVEDAVAGTIPPGTISDGSVFEIGTYAAGTGDMVGDIALVAGWEGVELTYAQCKAIFHAFFDWYEPRGKNEITWSNTGPTAAFVNGSIETFSDDFPRVGVEVAPGLTGAGDPATCGAHLHPSVTNYVAYSQDLSTGWTENGTCLSAVSTGTPRANGQEFYRLDDDEVGSAENIYTTVSGTTWSVSDTVDVALYATGTDTEVHTLRIREVTGGSCANPEQYIDFTTTGEWKLFDFQYTWADANCSNAFIQIYPNDVGTTTIGTVDVAYVAVTKNKTFGSLLCDTAGAAVTCGADTAISYDDSTHNHLLTSAGEFKGSYRMLFDFTPFFNDAVGGSTFFNYHKDANDYMFLWLTGADAAQLYHTDGGVSTAILTAADPTWLEGQAFSIDAFFNFERDSYKLNIKGATNDSATTALATPSGMTKLTIGSNNISPGGGCIGPIRIYR